MLTRAEKQTIIDGLKANIEKSQAIFLTNLVGIESNDAVQIRKSVRDAGGTIVITRNTLFGKASAGMFCEDIMQGLKGKNAVAFAFEDPASIAKILKEAGKNQDVV